MGSTLELLFGGVALMLLIGCANVSILLLARGTRRWQELVVSAKAVVLKILVEPSSKVIKRITGKAVIALEDRSLYREPGIP